LHRIMLSLSATRLTYHPRLYSSSLPSTFFFSRSRPPPFPPLFPSPPLFRSHHHPPPQPRLRPQPAGHLVAVEFRQAHVQQHRLRSEEHTSELQSLTNLVCRLLLEKKNT